MAMNRIQFQSGLSLPDFQGVRNQAPMRTGAYGGALAGRIPLPSMQREQSLRFP